MSVNIGYMVYKSTVIVWSVSNIMVRWIDIVDMILKQ